MGKHGNINTHGIYHGYVYLPDNDVSIIRRYVIYFFCQEQHGDLISSVQCQILQVTAGGFAGNTFLLVMMNTFLQIFADICR